MEKKILIAESGSGYGGSAKYLAGLLPLIDPKRFSVEVIAYGDGPFIQQMKREGRVFHYRPQLRFPWMGNATEKHSNPFSYLWYLFLGTVQLAVTVLPTVLWLKRRKIQLVHINNEIHSHLPLILAARLANCWILCHLHGWRKLTRIEKWASHCVDQFVSVTESGADFYGWQLGGREVTGIPNGILSTGEQVWDQAKRKTKRHELGLTEKECLAVVIGRLIPLKGHSVFIHALAKARRKEPFLRGLIVGNDPSRDGRYQRQLETELSALGLKSYVQFLPWQDHMSPIYEACDIVVQPSVEAESFGYVALEGMTAAKPIIASKIGGLVDVVSDGETGFLVTPGDSDQLADVLVKIATSRELAEKLGRQGEERARRLFTMDQNAAKVMGVYHGLLSEGQSIAPIVSLIPGKRKVVPLIKKIFFHTGAVGVMRYANRFKVPILMYHRVSVTRDPFFPSVSLNTFRNQMLYIKRHYKIISLDQLIRYWQTCQKVSARSLVVTFDDGDTQTWQAVFPVLQEFNIPVTIFLATGPGRENALIWTDQLRIWVKHTRKMRYAFQLNGFKREWLLTKTEERLRMANELSSKLKSISDTERRVALKQLEIELGANGIQIPATRLLSQNQIRSLRRQNMTFGAHSVTHPILSRMSLADARFEIYESKRELERMLSERIRHFAYPNGEAGDFNEDHERLVGQAGFDSACTAILGLNDANTRRYALRRVYATEESTSQFALRLAGIGS